jgi:hypothetical protein
VYFCSTSAIELTGHAAASAPSKTRAILSIRHSLSGACWLFATNPVRGPAGFSAQLSEALTPEENRRHKNKTKKVAIVKLMIIAGLSEIETRKVDVPAGLLILQLY